MSNFYITSHFIIKKNCTVQYWLKILCNNQSAGNGSEVVPRKAGIDESNAQFVVTVAGACDGGKPEEQPG